MSDNYDIAIIGAGSGGLSAADFAVAAGARVALIEKHRVGGDCTWTGCVPSKALLKAAKIAQQTRNASRFGLSAALEPVNLKAVMDYVRQSIAGIYQYETPEVLRGKGIDVFMGQARFADAKTLHITQAEGETTITAKNVIICTGARPRLPQIRGFSEVPYLTYETVFDLEKLPEKFVVMGGGPIGIEMAQAFLRLGSEVTIVHSRPRLIPKDEPEASAVLAQCLQAEGAKLFLDARVFSVAQTDKGIALHTNAGELTCDALLVATGRAPNVETMDLAKAGVQFTDRGIPVDDNLQTNVKHIYAVGDCLGGPQFTHYAGYQAFIAARNALFPGSLKGLVQSVPWTTFTDPEIAHAGMTEAEARVKYQDGVGVRQMQMAHVDRAVTESDTVGFIKVIHKKDGTVIGATVVAERAGEVIHEWALAIEHNWKVSDLAGTMHVYPTYSIANQQLAATFSIETLLGSTAGKILKRLSGLK
jgi:pyruvate/2-oxoglutarate dehydrogenase complex dihydrolipoamide dehydrogenase (E3) component